MSVRSSCFGAMAPPRHFPLSFSYLALRLFSAQIEYVGHRLVTRAVIRRSRRLAALHEIGKGDKPVGPCGCPFVGVTFTLPTVAESRSFATHTKDAFVIRTSHTHSRSIARRTPAAIPMEDEGLSPADKGPILRALECLFADYISPNSAAAGWLYDGQDGYGASGFELHSASLAAAVSATSSSRSAPEAVPHLGPLAASTGSTCSDGGMSSPHASIIGSVCLLDTMSTLASTPPPATPAQVPVESGARRECNLLPRPSTAVSHVTSLEKIGAQSAV